MALNIAAIEIISLTELQTVAPWITKEFIDNNQDVFKQILHDLGMNTKDYPFEEQYCTHRNRFNNIVTDYRWVGNSRIDKEWVESPYASQEAKDKALGNSLLIDAYRLRGMTEIE